MKKAEEEAEISRQQASIYLQQINNEQEEVLHKQILDGHQEEWFLKFKHYPKTMSELMGLAYFGLQSIYCVCFALTYFQLLEKGAKSSYAFAAIFQDNFKVIQSVALSLIAFIIVINAIYWLLMLFLNSTSQPQKSKVLEWIQDSIFPHFRWLNEGVFALSGLMMTLNSFANYFLFPVASFIFIFSHLLYHNRLERKDLFYGNNFRFGMLWRISMIIGYSINCLATQISDISLNKPIFAFFHLSLALMVYISYLTSGFNVYKAKITIKEFTAIIVVYTSSSLHFTIRLIKFEETNIVEFLLILVMVTILTYCRLTKQFSMIRNTWFKENTSQAVFILLHQLEFSNENLEYDASIRGIITHHAQLNCINSKCFSHSPEGIYDSKKKLAYPLSKLLQGKTSFLKFYIKCLFEQAIQHNPDDLDLKISFAEFLFTKLKNLFETLKLIVELKTHELGFIQKLRIGRLKQLMKAENEQISFRLFDQKLQIEKIMKLDQAFERILRKVQLSIRRNILFWKYVRLNEVNLSFMLNILQPNFALLKDTDRQWKVLAKYFEINSIWFFYFGIYTIFIRNEKISSDFSEKFGSKVDYEAVFKSSCTYVDKNSNSNTFFSSSLQFENQTSFLQCEADENKCLIKNVSKNFQTNYEFKKYDILNSSISRLMPRAIAENHSEVMLRWMKEGRSNNPEKYVVNKYWLQHGNGFFGTSFKYYKVFFSAESKLQFAMMLKKNIVAENAILVNSNLNLEGLSEDLKKRVKLSQNTCALLKQFHILLLAPFFSKFTPFYQYLSEKDNEFFLKESFNQRNHMISRTMTQKSMQTSNQLIQIEHPKVDYPKYLAFQKQIELRNVKLYIPRMSDSSKTMAGLKQFKNECLQLDQCRRFEKIKEFHEEMKRKGELIEYKINLSLEQLFISNDTYYAFTILSLEECINNAVDKQIKYQLDVEEKSVKKDRINQRQQYSHELNQLGEADVLMFLQKENHSQKFSISPQKNIFMKEEYNQVTQEVPHIRVITVALRSFALIMILISVSALLLRNNSVSKISTSMKYYNLTSFYHKSVFELMAQLYNRDLHADDPVFNAEQLTELKLRIQRINQDLEFKAFALDPKYNFQALISPFLNSSSNVLLKNRELVDLNQLAIIPAMLQWVTRVVRYCQLHPEASPRSMAEFLLLEAYLMPGFNQRMFNIRGNICSIILEQFQTLTNLTTAVYIIQALASLFTFAFILFKLFNTTNGFAELLSIFTQISDRDVKKIQHYSFYIMKLFENFRLHYLSSSISSSLGRPTYSETSTISNVMDKDLMELNLNKQLKKIEFGSLIGKIKCKSISWLLVLLFWMLIGSFTANFLMNSNIKILDNFETDGCSQIKNYPYINILMNGVYEKKSKGIFFSANKYAYSQQQLKLTKNSPAMMTVAIGTFDFNRYFKKINFDPPCELLVTIFNASYNWYIATHTNMTQMLNRCYSVPTLQLGLKSYWSAVSSIINNYISGLSDLEPRDISDLAVGIKQLDFFVQFFFHQFLSSGLLIISQIHSSNILVISFLCLYVLLIHVVIVELLLVSGLKQKYQEFRELHKHYIPEYVIINEKFIKARLIQQGFMIES